MQNAQASNLKLQQEVAMGLKVRHSQRAVHTEVFSLQILMTVCDGQWTSQQQQKDWCITLTIHHFKSCDCAHSGSGKEAVDSPGLLK